jgi:hypothetical protein
MGRLKKQDKPEELPKLFICFLLSVKKQGMIHFNYPESFLT